jgi:DNA repair protein RadC
LILALRHRTVENLHLILTDSHGCYLTDGGIARGTLSRIDTRFRCLIAPAMAHKAGGMVLVHNHPSGDPTPSDSDLAGTRALAAIARTLDIEVLDHIVIGWNSACSFKMAGLL